MDDEARFLAKALESLAGAEAELAGGRYNNRANRASYACSPGGDRGTPAGRSPAKPR
jgi:hypothetical protein